MKRYQIKFTGVVQGVGFRYYSTQIANKHTCTGWVKNLSDGNVLMEIQGSSEAIKKVLEEIQNIKHIIIDSIDQYPIDLINAETSFIVYYL